MKNITSILSSIAFIAAVILLSQSCTTKTSQKETEKTSCCTQSESNATTTYCADSSLNINTTEVSVLYFHATRRCATCEAVEKVSKEALNEFYQGKVKFFSINREEEKELAKQYNIEWQSLIITKGDKIVNLTNDAFLNARTNPDKLKAKIKSTIDQMN